MMRRSAENGSDDEALTDLLYPCKKPDVRQEIHQFRKEWESAHGPTDLSRNYTSMWPEDKRGWLSNTNLDMYYRGLPPFAQAWIYRKIEKNIAKGSGDSIPDDWLELFIEGRLLHPNSDSPSPS